MRRARAIAGVIAVLALATVPATGGSGVGGLFEAVSASAASAAARPAPTRLVALPNHVIANGSDPVTVALAAPVSPGSPAPTLMPGVAGGWKIAGDSWVFTPASTLLPCSSYALVVWARTDSTGYTELGRKRTLRLDVACPPIAGLQQGLARLGYLGATFRPQYDVRYPPGPETRREAAEHAYRPPHGRLAPDPSDAPAARIGQLDPTTRGALEVFQADNRLDATGEVNRVTWLTMLYDLTMNRRDPHPYTWVKVTESLPETLFLHRGGRVVFTTPVNTGVRGAETALGSFPIYARYVSTSMAGEDVDGEKYYVPDVPWVNYFNGGDAVHGYPRASYGFPQSNGCVELPIGAARTVFGMLQIGDMVEVVG